MCHLLRDSAAGGLDFSGDNEGEPSRSSHYPFIFLLEQPGMRLSDFEPLEDEPQVIVVVTILPELPQSAAQVIFPDAMQGLGLGYYSDLSDRCTNFLVTVGPALHGFSRTTKTQRDEPSVTQ